MAEEKLQEASIIPDDITAYAPPFKKELARTLMRLAKFYNVYF
jgi:hypothetical protein